MNTSLDPPPRAGFTVCTRCRVSAVDVVSCHATSIGVVAYGRCRCQLLHVLLQPNTGGPVQLVVRASRTARPGATNGPDPTAAALRTGPGTSR